MCKHNHKIVQFILLNLLMFLNVELIYSFTSTSLFDKNNYNQYSFTESNPEIILNSGWEFYWNKLLEPNDFNSDELASPILLKELKNWTSITVTNKKLPSFGFATYRLHFILPEKRPHISLYIPAAYASSKIWVNDILVAEAGKVGKSRENTIHRRFEQIIPLTTNETEYEIIIQVANFYHNKGGFDKPLTVGTTKYLSAHKINKIIADMFFIGSLGFIGVFFLLFFSLYWNKDKAILYLGIACISLSYMALSDRYAPFTKVFDSVSWILLTKIEYISLFLAGTSASLFFSVIFKTYAHKYYSRVLLYSFIFLSFLVIILPPPYFTNLVLPYLILMIINICYVFYIIILAFSGKRHDSVLLLVSMLLGTTVFCIHIFLFLGKLGIAIVYVNLGYIFVFLLLSMLLMARFSTAFKALEKAKELAVEQSKEISKKSRELSKVNTELKENVRQLKNYNIELDSFNHIVSHDLKTPLIAMNTLVTFIEEDLAMKIDESAKKHFDLLKGRITKMDALINGLLQYSKIAKGKKNKTHFTIHVLLHDIISMLNISENETFIFPEHNIELYVNKIALEHVLQNLITNAIKYNDKEKTIIRLSVEETSERYIFSVEDNGPGIDPKYHGKIFEMFSQLDSDDEQGTGIGLTIVQKLVSENKGNITVDSIPGKGTKFTFTWSKHTNL